MLGRSKFKNRLRTSVEANNEKTGFWGHIYGGMSVSEAQEMKQLREENARLKKLVADLSLDKDMLQSVIRKNSLGS